MHILDLLTGPAFLLFLAGAGIFCTIRLRGVQFFHFPHAWRETLGRGRSGKGGDAGTISPLQAGVTALAGALGTGNIAGVATAVVGGGPGAVFWMWLSSLFSMALKYAEIVLSVRYRARNSRGEQVGGPMYYMEKGLRCRWMAVWFAAACLLASFGVGNLAQSNAAAQAVQAAFRIPAWVTGLVLAIVAGLALFGGIRRIAEWTERVVPAMAVLYLGAAAWVLLLHWREIPDAVLQIVEDAFDFRSASGGIFGFLTARSVRFGVARGVFSNEAGMGSAAIVHAASDTDAPAREGMWGVLEVFLDTTVMCSVTALVLLAGGVPAGMDGAALTLAAFRGGLGEGAAAFLAAAILFFAAASILGWSYCGEKALEYLTGSRRARNIYRLCYLAAIAAGAAGPVEEIWLLSDLLNLAMAVPNVTAVLLLSGTAARETGMFLRNGRKKFGGCSNDRVFDKNV